MIVIKKLVPLHDKVLIKRDKAPTKTPGGIDLPETTEEGTQKTGVVVDSGPGYFDSGKLVENDVKPGQRVLYNVYSSDEEIEIGGSVHDLVDCSQIDGRVEE